MKKVAVITGGSRGIGAACVEKFARNGWSVVSLSRHETELVERLRAEGLDVAWMPCDVAEPQQVAETFAAIRRRYHRVDALVNNAGVSLIRMLADTQEEDWQRVLQTNLSGAYRCSRAALPEMLRLGGGSIVNVASMWGEVGASCEAAYSASKAGLIGLTKALAKELGPSGVRVNCVSPGVIDTEMNAELDEETMQSLREETPLGRIGTAREVAEAIFFLAGEGAGFITGQVLGVSGGMVI